MPVLITLNQIRKNSPCESGWVKLLSGLKKTEADDVPFPISFILDNNGIDDANWCLGCLEGHDREIHSYMADIAESVLHIFEKERPDDMRPRLAIQAKRDYADGKISREEWDAACAAAGDAARDAARDAAGDAARDAACAAAWDAAWDAEQKKQAEMFRKWFA